MHLILFVRKSICITEETTKASSPNHIDDKCQGCIAQGREVVISIQRESQPTLSEVFRWN